MLLLCSAGFGANAEVLEGRVFLDGNRNGLLDAGEAGVAGVAVSNGRDVTRTDETGRYQLALSDGDTLFMIKPAGYALPQQSDGMAKYWQHQAPQGQGTGLRYGGIAPQTADGQLPLWTAENAKQSAALEALVLADPQPKSAQDVDYFKRDIIEPLTSNHGASMGMVLGDVVSDDLTLFDGISASLARLSIPWLVVPGNHDIDFDAATDAESLLSFRQRFGPDTFAWEEPQAVFIALDDVIYNGAERRGYIGGLREEQFEFLQNYLATLDERRLVVLMVHIPLFNAFRNGDSFRPDDRKRLFSLLARFPHRLILSGHTHAQRHHFHGAADGWTGTTPLHEYNVGTACGGYWSGPFDAQGIPDSRMADGTPNGFARLRVDSDGNYQLRYEVARDPQHPGIELSGPAVLRKGSWPGVGLYANVLMGWADTRVEMRIDEGEWRPMTYSPGLDRQVLAENLRDDQASALRGYDRVPEAEESKHRWRISLPTNLPVGKHRIEVRAIDPWRGEMTAHSEYQLVDLP